MRILLTNHALEHLGGTEVWTYAMARELGRRGHHVDVATFLRGEPAQHISELPNVQLVYEPDSDGYGLALFNHNTCLAAWSDLPGFKVFTSHGPRQPLERPYPGADAYVAVSEEIKKQESANGYDMTVITNGVDLEAFRPGPPHNGAPRVLSMCKVEHAGAMVAKACKRLDYPFKAVHYLKAPMWDMHRIMRQFDIVVGCGRTAIEGLASGCDVLVFDAREHVPQADGWITPVNVEILRERNFSTRTLHTYWTVGHIETNLSRYEGRSQWGRQWALDNANIRDKADAYLELLPMSIDEPVHDPDLTAEYEVA